MLDNEIQSQFMVIVDTASVHPILSKWWEGHGWPAIPVDLLPPVCAVGMTESRMTSAVFAYEPTRTVAWMDYMVTDPESGLAGARSLKQLCKDFADSLEARGFKYIHSCCRQESLGRLIEKSGFQRTDDGVIHFLRINSN